MTRLDRRRFISFLMSSAASAVMGVRAQAGPSDRGIGGTGAAPPVEGSDRGIGGTGVIGTIRKFGSIYVNDMKISYAQDAEVRIDGQPGRLSDLRIGQVVRVAATGPDDDLSTRRIDVTSEVVGPVQKVDNGEITVLGQKVATDELGTDTRWKVGDTVAVSGLRRPDGTIAASLVERRTGAANLLAGPVERGRDGRPRIGGTVLTGLDPKLVGQRVIVDGGLSGARFAVARGVRETALLPPQVRTLSIESYVGRQNGRFTLGSGFKVSNVNGFSVPRGQSVRAVIRTSVGPNGRLTANSFRRSGGDMPGRGGGMERGGRAGSGIGRGAGERPGGGPLAGGRGREGLGGKGFGREPRGVKGGIPGEHGRHGFGNRMGGHHGGFGGLHNGPRGGGHFGPGRFGGPGRFSGRGFGGGGFGGFRGGGFRGGGFRGGGFGGGRGFGGGGIGGGRGFGGGGFGGRR